MSLDFTTTPITERHEVHCPHCGAWIWAVDTIERGASAESLGTPFARTDITETLRPLVPPDRESGDWGAWFDEVICKSCGGGVQWLCVGFHGAILEATDANRSQLFASTVNEEWSVCRPASADGSMPPHWLLRQAGDLGLGHVHIFAPAPLPWFNPLTEAAINAARDLIAALGAPAKRLVTQREKSFALAWMAERVELESAVMLDRAAEAQADGAAAVPSLEAWRNAILAMEAGESPAGGTASLASLLALAALPENVTQAIEKTAAFRRAGTPSERWTRHLLVLCRLKFGETRKFEEWFERVRVDRFPLRLMSLKVFGDGDYATRLPAITWVDWASGGEMVPAGRACVSAEAWEHLRGAARQMAKSSDRLALQEALSLAIERQAWPVAAVLAETAGARVPFAAIASTPCGAAERLFGLRLAPFAAIAAALGGALGGAPDLAFGLRDGQVVGGCFGDDAVVLVGAIFADESNAVAIHEERFVVETSFARWAEDLGSSPAGVGAIEAILRSLSDPDVALRLLRALIATSSFRNPEQLAPLRAQLEQRSLRGAVAETPVVGVEREAARPLAASASKGRRL